MCIYFILDTIPEKRSVPKKKTAIPKKQKAPFAYPTLSFCNRLWHLQSTLKWVWHRYQCPAMMLTRIELESVLRVRDVLCHVKVRCARVGRKAKQWEPYMQSPPKLIRPGQQSIHISHADILISIWKADTRSGYDVVGVYNGRLLMSQGPQ